MDYCFKCSSLYYTSDTTLRLRYNNNKLIELQLFKVIDIVSLTSEQGLTLV